MAVIAVLAVAIVVAIHLGNKTEAPSLLVEGERPVWDFEGPYEASDELILKARTETERLKDLVGSGEFSDYDIYVGIAEQHSLLGEGKESYEYLLKAIEESKTRSLAFSNLGTLFGRVGALESGKRAYEMALDRDDNVTNRINYIQHLEQYFADDLDLVESAHTFAIEKFPNSKVLQQRYESFKKLYDR